MWNRPWSTIEILGPYLVVSTIFYFQPYNGEMIQFEEHQPIDHRKYTPED